VKARDSAAGGIGLQEIGKTGFGASGLIKERQWPARGRNRLRNAFTVFLRLNLNTDEGRAFLFGLDYPRRLVIDKEERYLESKFGTEYLNYKSSVRRWA